MCGGCEIDTNLFIEQEDIDFSLDYWGMNQKKRNIYTNLTEEGKVVFSKLTKNSKNNFLKMKKRERDSYISQLINDLYLFFDLPNTYLETLRST